MNAWFDELDSALERHDEGAINEVLLRPPEGGVLPLADRLNRCIQYGADGVDVRGLARAFAVLLHRKGDREAGLVLDGQDSAWNTAALAALARPAQWAALLDATPGTDVVDRAEAALFRLLLRGITFDRVLTQLGRRGPGPWLEPVARTGLLSQFDFIERADRTRRFDRRIKWKELAIHAARARGALCCVGMLELEVEDALRRHLGLSA